MIKNKIIKPDYRCWDVHKTSIKCAPFLLQSYIPATIQVESVDIYDLISDLKKEYEGEIPHPHIFGWKISAERALIEKRIEDTYYAITWMYYEDDTDDDSHIVGKAISNSIDDAWLSYRIGSYNIYKETNKKSFAGFSK